MRETTMKQTFVKWVQKQNTNKKQRRISLQLSSVLFGWKQSHRCSFYRSPPRWVQEPQCCLVTCLTIQPHLCLLLCVCSCLKERRREREWGLRILTKSMLSLIPHLCGAIAVCGWMCVLLSLHRMLRAVNIRQKKKEQNEFQCIAIA